MTLEEKIEALLDTIEIDVCALESYKCVHHNQDFARFAEPDDESWDEDEERYEKLKVVKDYFETDGAYEYIDIDESENQAALDYVNGELDLC